MLYIWHITLTPFTRVEDTQSHSIQGLWSYPVKVFRIRMIKVPVIFTFCDDWIYPSYDFRFSDDIFYMTGRVPPLIFRIMWKFISPIAIAIMLLVSLYNMIVKEPQYEIWNKKTVSTIISGICMFDYHFVIWSSLWAFMV